MEDSMLANDNVGWGTDLNLSFVKVKKSCRGKRELYEQLKKGNGIHRAQYDWSKKFRERRIVDVTAENSHPKESSSLLIIHYPLGDQDRPIEQHNNFRNAIGASLNFQPERDELSIFDSAWATLREEP